MSQGELGRGLCISWQSWCIHTGTWQKHNHINSLTTIHCLNMAIFYFNFANLCKLPSDKLLQKLDWRKCCVVRCWLLLWVSSYKQIYKVSKSMFVFWKYVVSHFFFICTPLWGMVSSRQFITCWNWILHLMSFVTSLSLNKKRFVLQLIRGHFSFFSSQNLQKKYLRLFLGDWNVILYLPQLVLLKDIQVCLALIPVRWVCIRDVNWVGLL